MNIAPIIARRWLGDTAEGMSSARAVRLTSCRAADTVVDRSAANCSLSRPAATARSASICSSVSGRRACCPCDASG
jgi:hypothetical protein